MDLDEVADELYGLHPDGFTAARTAREKEARAGGDRALAAAVKGLGKPSTAAWVCNLLVRRQPEEIASLVELGGLLREAQEDLAGDQLRELDGQRRRLVTALTRQARALARAEGHPVSTAVATQVEETLRAALADPDAAEALLGGRLTAPMSYSGLGLPGRPDLRLVPRPARGGGAEAVGRAGRSPARRGDVGRGDVGRGDVGRREARREEARREEARREEARRAAEERRRRELAEARAVADDATAAADAAAAERDAERQRTQEVVHRHEALLARVEELAAELARAREEGARVAGERSRAERRREVAERRSADADRARDRARARVEQLERPAAR